MEVLNEVKDAHLFLKSKNLGEKEEQIRIRELFEGLGLAADRVHLEGHSPSVEYHLDRYQNIDIALDTFPYTGCTTTADALWMGVPVLTVSGNTMVSRQASAVLKAAGHPEWICKDKYDLTAKVKKILSDPQKLSRQRKRMREELKNSELLNYEELATDLKDTFKEWWGSFLTKNNVISRSNSTGKSWELANITRNRGPYILLSSIDNMRILCIHRIIPGNLGHNATVAKRGMTGAICGHKSPFSTK